MRILIVNNLFGDNARGGAERVILAEAKALIEAGHEVAVLRSSTEDKREKWEGMTVFSLKSVNFYPYFDLGKHGLCSRFVWHLVDLFDFRSVMKVRLIIKRFRPKVVHTHNLMGVGYLLPRLLRYLKLRHVHTLHDVQLFNPSGALPVVTDKISLSFLSKIYATLTSWLMGSPDTVISPSFFLLKAHRKYRFFPKSVGSVIANPLTRISRSVKINEATSVSNPIFLFAGQLEDQKGVRTLLRAWDGWSGNHEANLEIAGDGSLKEEVERMAKKTENLRYLGRLESEDLEQAYKRAAFTLLPSEIIENAPTTITEGYAQGVPAVVAATGGVPEMVEEGETGFLFPPGDYHALRNAINRALTAWKDGHWSAMSEQASKKATSLTIDNHLSKLLVAYKGES